MKKEIKATDLRIGNYVESNIKDSYNGITEWKQIKVIGVLDGSMYDEIDKVYFIDPQVSTFNLLRKYTKTGADCLRGVSLTEEWFLKFGFIKNDVSNNYVKELEGDNLKYLIIRKDNTVIFTNEPNMFLSMMRIIKIEYVHQLQNLYFAVTGLELQITD